MIRLTLKFILASLLLTLFISSATRAEVFMVTSNADAGPGTLREALIKAAANGSADKDFIYFNLADQSESGRTITLLSQLPDVSSNLDIDGSTQSGIVFGRSTAKIQIIAAFTFQDSYIGLNLNNVNDVGIYGLYLRNTTVFNLTSGVVFERVVGVALTASKNIRLGDVGKGNVICGFNRDLSSNFRLSSNSDSYVENFSMKSTLLGVEANGITEPARTNALQSYNAYMQNLYGIVNIGDGTPAGQNVVAKGFYIHQSNTGQYADPIYNTPAFINFKYNILGNNLDLSVADNLVANAGIYIGSSAPYTLSTIKIEDNVVGGSTAIQLTGVKNAVEIKRNYIGVNRNFIKITNVNTGIFVYYVDKVQIGGDNPADANYIGYCKPVNVWPSTSAAINKNSFFCTKNSFPMILDNYGMRIPPNVEITDATANSVVGKATPNSTIELFYSDLCGTCSPETYFASTVADASGNWQYSGTLLRSVIASATLNGITSEFTRTRVDVSGIKITHTCGNTGSITGVLPLSATYVEWLDATGNIVGRGKDLLNVPIGTYRLKATNGDCSEVTPWFEIKKGLITNAANVRIINPACGTGGSISGLQVVNNTSSPAVYSWKNELGTEVATTLNLTNVTPGRYTLTLSTSDNSCSEIYGPVTLTTSSGPNVSLQSLSIKPANCGTNSGSITGVIATGSGTLTYKWKNVNNLQVAGIKDLINQPPGKYTLEVTDQSSCGAVITPVITIPDANAITIDDSRKQIFNPTCVGNNGSINGLQIGGANAYIWKNSGGQIVGNQVNLEGMPAGSYQLTASNPSCTKTYDLILVAQPNLINVSGGITKIITDASCGLNNGKIIVMMQNPIHPPTSYRWEDELGRTIGGNTAVLENVDAGAYKVYGIDDNGCEKYLITYRVNRYAELVLEKSNVRIADDNCNQRLGSITGMQISGGLAPYNYKWTNSAGVQIGNSLDIYNLPKDDYKLEITDAINCQPLISDFVVDNLTSQISAPTVMPIQLCSPGEATLRASGLTTATSYALYENKDALFPVDVSVGGVFKIDARGDKNYFVTQRMGDCESVKVEVKITVGLSGLTVANSFTPNNDGVNDIWNLKGIENYPKANIQIFNRVGNKVYESVGYHMPFDGTTKGTRLPTGVYYYVIKLGQACEMITGSLTLLN
ncbi:gliding motility-associated C-terminal domain-containing protein [Pedobacter sp. PF22-3]|uniref:gliding motility-associated C-terminal domain-containing protein n=1 Tax=Pedobacter sp. PF22-3 TaxID=2994467 RepID=UPI002246F477|nr:gliding motility-associated C-terminal domain-containing protein [Pedobacter sp. PF22-3]MCX2492252.1 gliding motility-associated C-terminal domain-containing protein [Pedobacter sp. PF22-3]